MQVSIVSASLRHGRTTLSSTASTAGRAERSVTAGDEAGKLCTWVARVLTVDEQRRELTDCSISRPQ
jgi:hypothetical protein